MNMKTIEEAAYEESVLMHGVENEKQIDRGNTYNGFVSGVEFAQRWIDISDEMPEIGQQILTKNGNNIGINLPLTMWDIKDITEFATQWRPIDLK